MQLHIIAISNKMPLWVKEVFLEYTKRFPREWLVTLTEIPYHQQGKDKEEQKILATIPPKGFTIALDERGLLLNTQELAIKIEKLQNQVTSLHFLIGGPEGLSEKCLTKANLRWSLSPLTFPHPLVRIIVIEQLYRAISILKHHPYHRS